MSLRKSRPPDAAADGRLDGWKEIAAYLRVDVKTCMRWEKELALPVIRLNPESKRSKVLAFRSDLDQWILKKAGKPPKTAKRARIMYSAFSWKMLVLGASALGILVLVGSLASPPRRHPEKAEVKGRSFNALDGEGRSIWNRDIPASIDQEPFYQNEDYIAKSGELLLDLDRPKYVLFDSDGDGLNEIVTFWNHDDPALREIVLFDHDGEFLWRKAMEYSVRYSHGSWGVNFLVRQIAVEDIDLDGIREVLVLWRYPQRFPSVFQVYSAAGILRSQYEHTGELQHFFVRYLPGRSGTEIVLGGTNNLLGGDAVLIGLDGKRLSSGLGPPYTVPEDLASETAVLLSYVPKEFTPASQKYYLRFRHNEISRSGGAQWINPMRIVPSSTAMTIGVDFDPGHFIYYSFNEEMKLFDLRPSPEVIRSYPGWIESGRMTEPIDDFRRRCAADVFLWADGKWISVEFVGE